MAAIFFGCKGIAGELANVRQARLERFWGCRITCILLPATMLHLPRPVVKVRVPRRPGAVECKRQLLVVLVLLTPHPEGSEHFLLKNNGLSFESIFLYVLIRKYGCVCIRGLQWPVAIGAF